MEWNGKVLGTKDEQCICSRIYLFTSISKGVLRVLFAIAVKNLDQFLLKFGFSRYLCFGLISAVSISSITCECVWPSHTFTTKFGINVTFVTKTKLYIYNILNDGDRVVGHVRSEYLFLAVAVQLARQGLHTAAVRVVDGVAGGHVTVVPLRDQPARRLAEAAQRAAAVRSQLLIPATRQTQALKCGKPLLSRVE